MDHDKIVSLALDGIRAAGRTAGAADLNWTIDLRPNLVEFSGSTDKTKPGHAAGVAKRWAVALNLTEVDPQYAGTAVYTATSGPIIVTVTGIVDPETYRKRIEINP